MLHHPLLVVLMVLFIVEIYCLIYLFNHSSSWTKPNLLLYCCKTYLHQLLHHRSIMIIITLQTSVVPRESCRPSTLRQPSCHFAPTIWQDLLNSFLRQGVTLHLAFHLFFRYYLVDFIQHLVSLLSKRLMVLRSLTWMDIYSSCSTILVAFESLKNLRLVLRPMSLVTMKDHHCVLTYQWLGDLH